MRNRPTYLLLLALLGILGLANRSLAEAIAESPKNANYRIEVELEPETKILTGRQTVTWRNLQSTPTQELWFHLYWNAWRNNLSTWMAEDRLRGRSSRGDDIRDDDWSWIVVDRIELVGSPTGSSLDLTATARYEAPDDGNVEDRTVLVVDLPAPVAPGETVEVDLEWRAKVPRTFARTGFRGDFFFIAHWFPKLGVLEAEGWNCHQFHAGTEFFSDYGDYDVAITLPDRFVVGATGREVSRQPVEGARTEHRYRQEDVHAFTWTASPDFIEVLDRFDVAGLPAVDLRLLIQPEHRRQAERHLHATKATLETYGSWYGPYTYDHLTVVDPAYGSGAGGMEYPTLFTSGTRLFNPFGGGSPEGVTVHEAGHQFWYGLVGNNEFEHAWLDEGLNTYSTNRTMQETYGPRRYVWRFFRPAGTRERGFFAVLLPGFGYSRSPQDNRVGRYRKLAEIDRQDTPSFRYHPAGGSALSYSKTALWLGTLERWLGWERLQPAMARFFEAWRFGHPGPEDFFTALEEGTGENLGWFFDQVFRSSERFDYAIDSASSEAIEVRGYVGGENEEWVLVSGDSTEAPRYRSEVVVRRHGGGIFPVELLLVFDDGSERRLSWSGEERWRLFVEESDSPLRHAVVDPDDILLLDLDRTNNSRVLEPQESGVAARWASRWMVWLQDFLMTMTFFG